MGMILVAFASIASLKWPPSAGVAIVVPQGVISIVERGMSIGELLPIWSVLPFVGILLSIALLPLFIPQIWHSHFGKISATWAVFMMVPFIISFKSQAVHEIVHILLVDYVPFIILLTTLFTISSGIVIRGNFSGTPIHNLGFLLAGTALASWIGTTGASMVMIRPLLRANAWRQKSAHVVIFFIFLVSNIGGALTPLGDPPLFLGFLHQVPFFWVTSALLAPTLVAVVILLGIFFLIDRYFYRREIKTDAHPRMPVRIRIDGWWNLFYLAVTIGAILLSGIWASAPTFSGFGLEFGLQGLVRDLVLIICCMLAYVSTPDQLRKANEFSWGPIKEVAKLFAGIFVTIIPALEILRAGSHGALAPIVDKVRSGAHYFWASGGLSTFLDNAPTYLAFFNTALGRCCQEALRLGESIAVAQLIREHSAILAAISIGSVFMGANSYIGNAPNFMVKSIAEESGVPMPSFFGYLVWSGAILIPLFVIMTAIFF